MPVAVAAAIACLWPVLAQPAGASRVERLDRAQLTGQRIVVGFSGHAIPRRLRAQIHHGTVAGVILFSDNYGGASGARDLIRRLQGIPREPPLRHVPLLVMLDQEGGIVKRLPGPPAYSAQEMGRRSRALCRRQGLRTGRYLRRIGVNVNLAPVLDVARPGSAIEAQHRAFGRTVKRVRGHAVAFASGLQRPGVAATAKHFPGLGAAPKDTDFAVQRLGVSRKTLRHRDERPYRRFQASGGDMVMLSTAIYPAFDGRRPAALSRTLATKELRHRMGFDGVSITDALDTVSARDIGGARRLARLGARAGSDLLLYTDVAAGAHARHALAAALAADDVTRQKFRRSVARVLALRSGLPR